MAVENKWVNSDVEAGRYGQTSKVAGGQLLTIAGTFEVAAADSDTSIYKLAKIPANAIPIRGEIYADASLGTSSFSVGFYEEDGTIVDVAVLMAATDLTAGVALTAASNNGIKSVPIADVGDKVWELLGKTINNKKEGYVLAVTAPTTGGAAGTIAYVYQFIIG